MGNDKKAEVAEKFIKHESLDNAIDNVESVLHSVEQMYEKIMNMTGEDKPSTGKGSSSLHDVLTHGSDRLYETTEKIHVMLNKIEDAIF